MVEQGVQILPHGQLEGRGVRVLPKGRAAVPPPFTASDPPLSLPAGGTPWERLCRCRSCYVLSRSVVSDSLRPRGLQPARLLCPWDTPGMNTGVGCHALLQGVFLTQGSNPSLLQVSYIAGRVFLPGESHGQRSLAGCSPRGRKESDTTERLHFTSLPLSH